MVIEQDRADVVPPTNLRLFKCYGQLQAPIEEVYHKTVEFIRQFHGTTRAFDSLVHASNSRLERILESSNDVHSQLLSTASMITYGQVYLIFEDELPKTGITENQVYDFFKICARINTTFWDDFIARNKRTDNSLKPVSRDFTDKRFIEVAKHDIKNPPAWFNRSLDQWAYLVLGYANFAELIDSRTNNIITPSGRMLPSNRILIFSGQYPDWYNIDSNQPPSRDGIIAELEEDFDSLELIDGQHALLHRNIDEIKKAVYDKISRTSIWIYKRLKDLHPDSPIFANSVCITEIIRVLYESSYRDFYQRQKPDDNPDQSHLRALKKMTRAESFEVNPEYLALWLEKVLTGTRINWKLTDTLDKEKIDMLNNTLSPLVLHQAEKRPALQSIKYDIAPLMELLPDEDKHMLFQLASLYEEDCLEEYIWVLSEALSPYTTPSVYESKSRNVISLMERVRNFSVRWYLENSEWAFTKLTEEIEKATARQHNDQDLTIQTRSENPQIIEIAQQFDEKIKEVRTLASEVKHDPLTDWRLVYTPRRIISTEGGVLISGADRFSIESTLEKYLREEGITCSVPVSSIVNVLGWIINMPREIEQVRIGKNIAGEEYKKIKRGRMRILYRIDRTDNTLYFFLHHKDGWGYGF